MSSIESSSRSRRLNGRVRGTVVYATTVCMFPVLSIVLGFLSAPDSTLAQCDVHEETKLTASDAAQDDLFGSSVSISGDVTVVGARLDDCAEGVECGSAYVYRFSQGSWTEEQKLTASDANEQDWFGYSVSVSGDVAVVGAVYRECKEQFACGAAYVYRFHPGAPSLWVEEQKLTASDAAGHDLFGRSVSISGDTIVVGADYANCGIFLSCGSAYVYRFHPGTPGHWVEEQRLTAPDAAYASYFGYSVSVSGDEVLVGAPGDDCATASRCGSAYVYRRQGNIWQFQRKLVAPDAEQGREFGNAVSVSGNTAVVVAPQDDRGDPFGSRGSAYVFRYNGATWGIPQKIVVPLVSFFGSVSVSGDTFVIGAWNSAYVYRFDGSGWVERAKLTTLDAAPNDYFGVRVAVNGNTVVVAAAYDDCTAGTACGSAFVFGLADCNSNSVFDECDIREGISLDNDANGIPDECETGACCDESTGLCVDDAPAQLCSGFRQTWRVNIDCEELDPGCTAPEGACCDHEPFGGCTDDLTRAECNCERCEWTEDTSCDEVECPHDSIPTVGGWGIAILSLLLLSAAKIRFGYLLRSQERPGTGLP